VDLDGSYYDREDQISLTCFLFESVGGSTWNLGTELHGLVRVGETSAVVSVPPVESEPLRIFRITTG
jgi:hypothetical protein